MPAFRDMQFLTTADVADKLKLHPQVILRKLKSGEIPGYKLGKEWRVADHDLLNWLQERSNQRVITARTKVEKTFFKEDKLSAIPAQRKKRIFVLERLLEEFETQRTYTEAEVNKILGAFHSDVCTLRREFICEHMMVRKDGIYKRSSSYFRCPDDGRKAPTGKGVQTHLGPNRGLPIPTSG